MDANPGERTTANAALVDACRAKQRDHQLKELAEIMMSSLVEDDMLGDYCGRGGYDEDDFIMPQPRPVSAATAANCRARGVETPGEYEARRAHNAEVRAQRARERVQHKEEREAFNELPVQAKPTMDFRKLLQQKRTAKGLTQVQLAQKCKVTAKVVSDWEAGRANVPADKMKILKHVLGL